MNNQPTEKRYWAFISYSHKDSDVAKWLHRKLELYQVPKSLIGTSQRNGVVPRRIFPVFRDRDELPTSNDLGENIRQALENSRYLVVIASPDSATSKWVNEEVSWFKRVHRNSNVLVLIAKGEPNATDRGFPEHECFCPSLRYNVTESGELDSEPSEPIAADKRPSGDGESRAFLKIIAGILGVSFDDLYRRESRRRRVRLLFAASGGTVAMIAVIALLTNLSRVKKEQAEMSVKQKEIQDVVVSMKESGPYKEVGKLPKVRKEELERLLTKLAVEPLINRSTKFLNLELIEDLKSQLGRVVQRFSEKKTNNWSELKGIYDLAGKEMLACIRKLRPAESTIINRRLVEKIDEIEMELGAFPKNLEEKLVIQDISKDFLEHLNREIERLPSAQNEMGRIARHYATQLEEKLQGVVESKRLKSQDGDYPSGGLNIEEYSRWATFYKSVEDTVADERVNPIDLMDLGDLKKDAGDHEGAFEAYSDAADDAARPFAFALVRRGPEAKVFNVMIEQRRAEVARQLKKKGAPGFQSREGDEQIASALGSLCWNQTIAGDFKSAIQSGLEARKVFPQMWAEGNLAHAYMLFGDWKEALAIYIKHRGETIELNGEMQKWEDLIKCDFEQMKEAGVSHQNMITASELLGFKFSADNGE